MKRLFCSLLLLLAINAAYAERQTLTINVPIELSNLPPDRRVALYCEVYADSSFTTQVANHQAIVPLDAAGNYRGTMVTRFDLRSAPTRDARYRCTLFNVVGTRDNRYGGLLDSLRGAGYPLQSGVSQTNRVTGPVLQEISAIREMAAPPTRLGK